MMRNDIPLQCGGWQPVAVNEKGTKGLFVHSDGVTSDGVYVYFWFREVPKNSREEVDGEKVAYTELRAQADCGVIAWDILEVTHFSGRDEKLSSKSDSPPPFEGHTLRPGTVGAMLIVYVCKKAGMR